MLFMGSFIEKWSINKGFDCFLIQKVFIFQGILGMRNAFGLNQRVMVLFCLDAKRTKRTGQFFLVPFFIKRNQKIVQKNAPRFWTGLARLQSLEF